MPEISGRHERTFALQTEQVDNIKLRMLSWSKQFDILSFFDSNGYSSTYKNYECLLAVGAVDTISGDDGDMLAVLQEFHDKHKDWLFGHISYDYKNNLEDKLTSGHRCKH